MCETQQKLEIQQQQLQTEVNAVHHNSAHNNFKGSSNQGNYFGTISYNNAPNQDYGAYQNSQCIKQCAHNNSQSGVGRGSVHQAHKVQNRTGSSGCGRCGGKFHSSEICFHK